MKVYLDEPIPDTCSCCPLGKKLEAGPWYTCFVTGKTSTSITTERPGYCPIEEECEHDGDKGDSAVYSHKG